MSDRHLHDEGHERPNQDWIGGAWPWSGLRDDLPVPKGARGEQVKPFNGASDWERGECHEDTPLNLTRKQRERLQRVLMDECQRHYMLNAKERASAILRRIENEV